MRTLAIALILMGTLVGGRSMAAAQGKDAKARADVLFSAKRLDDSAVGYAGQRTATYAAFSDLYKAGKASTEAAKHLVAAATPEGRVYGLLILRHAAPADAEAWTNRMLQDRSPVTIMNGCVIHQSTVGELVTEIRAGKSIIILPSGTRVSKLAPRPLLVISAIPEPAGRRPGWVLRL